MAKPPKPDLYERAQKAAQSQYQVEIDERAALFQRGYYDAKTETKRGPVAAFVFWVAKAVCVVLVLYLFAILAASC